MTSPSRLTLLLLAAILAVALGGFWWLTVHDPSIRYLPEDPPAQWVAYPLPPSASVRAAVEHQAVFRRSFTVDQVPGHPRLRIRAMGRCRLTINDVEIVLRHDMAANWKQGDERSLHGVLHHGPNTIVATVANDRGPPALWLSLTGDGLEVITDDQWTVSLAGAVERPARLATAPLEFGNGNALSGGERTVDALRARWPTLLLFAGLSAGLLVLAHAWEKRQRAAGEMPEGQEPWPRRVLLACAVLWLVLFVNNVRSLYFPLGFDATAHLDYIRYLQQRNSLPLADDGWQMHQPPLAYLLSEAPLRALNLSATDTSAIVVLRGLSLALGILQLFLVFTSLRRIFPDQPRRQVVGLVLSAFLPAELYLFHYITNETLLATLGTASVYLCLRVLPLEKPSVLPCLGLGACLGAALLTKVTALVLAVVILTVLAGRLAARRERNLRMWGDTVGLPLLVAVLISGWHYARVWNHFGTPLVSSYDPVSGIVWWQDQGYSTLAYLFRFGQSLDQPFFSAAHGFPDGLYSTLWGDGLWGGVATPRGRPPWNYDLMAAGYLLALLPTVLIVLGTVAAVVQLVRRPSAEWFLLIGLSFALIVALVYHFLRQPYFCHVKAFYALMALVPLGAFAGGGFDLLARQGKAIAAGLGLALGVWAMAAYASFWVVPEAPATQLWLGLNRLENREPTSAEQFFERALRADPENTAARLQRAELLDRTARSEAARRQIEHVLAQDPHSLEARLAMARRLQQEGKIETARNHLQMVVDSSPEQAGPYEQLGALLAQQGETEAAVEIFRRGLAVAPDSPTLHAGLGAALAERGETGPALEHYRLALQLRPREPHLMNEVARLLAAGPDARFRNGPEAVKLAERACLLTGHRNPVYLDSLAAAYAQAGRFDEAIAVQKKAVELLPTDAPESRRAAMQKRLQLYETGQPFREGP